MSQIERIRWFWWRLRLAIYLRKIGFFKRRLSAFKHAWAYASAFEDYFKDGMTWRDAFNEDMSYAD